MSGSRQQVNQRGSEMEEMMILINQFLRRQSPFQSLFLCSLFPLFQNLLKNQSVSQDQRTRGGGNLGVCMTRIERKKNWRKKSRTWRTLKSAQRKQLLKHYEIFLRLPLVSVCENFAGDIFSWLPSIFIFALLKNLLNFCAG